MYVIYLFCYTSSNCNFSNGVVDDIILIIACINLLSIIIVDVVVIIEVVVISAHIFHCILSRAVRLMLYYLCLSHPCHHGSYCY